jgi:hypothetical protein
MGGAPIAKDLPWGAAVLHTLATVPQDRLLGALEKLYLDIIAVIPKNGARHSVGIFRQLDDP